MEPLAARFASRGPQTHRDALSYPMPARDFTDMRETSRFGGEIMLM
jgi:hypothetical protein